MTDVSSCCVYLLNQPLLARGNQFGQLSVQKCDVVASLVENRTQLPGCAFCDVGGCRCYRDVRHPVERIDFMLAVARDRLRRRQDVADL